MCTRIRHSQNRLGSSPCVVAQWVLLAFDQICSGFVQFLLELGSSFQNLLLECCTPLLDAGKAPLERPDDHLLRRYVLFVTSLAPHSIIGVPATANADLVLDATTVLDAIPWATSIRTCHAWPYLPRMQAFEDTIGITPQIHCRHFEILHQLLLRPLARLDRFWRHGAETEFGNLEHARSSLQIFIAHQTHVHNTRFNHCCARSPHLLSTAAQVTTC